MRAFGEVPGHKADGSLLVAGQKKKLQELYQLGLQLGSGGFGTVFSGIRLSDGSPVAIKRVARDSVLQWDELVCERGQQDRAGHGWQG
ncbi:serine/threonine-protein kinase pim-1-like [Cyanistes caeruleus]|uniref:serine/threonine-protein kinase pim-1-like n=1 Tax=Cyanistes caeruleus TaxID=156563 RepID=UPI000CDB3537|nr:serine/threonine-protein kinase pim-1-like [Cyanistes caeruleus]XP_023804054.1 serine/threonine-protein kinase pim-1-like [Cyanistes caeruleus]